MITDVEYMQIVNEVYDLSDYKTKKAVLFCNEAKKIDNLESIVSNLYNHIKTNVNGIDFGTIPKSKGVITDVENFAEMVDCINSVHDMVQTYGENTNSIDAFSTAIANIQKRERLFTKAFALNIEFPIMMYNMTVTAIVSAVSLLLSASIEFVKEGHDSFKASLDKVGYRRTKDHVLYEYIVQFNKNCDNGNIDKVINACVKNNMVATRESDESIQDLEPVDEGIVSNAIGAVAAAGGIKAAVTHGAMTALTGTAFGNVIMAIAIAIPSFIMLLWAMRKVVYYVLRSFLTISDWFDAQATYLQINANNLQYRDDDKGSDHRKKVYQKQMKWVERFRKISNLFALRDSKASKEANDAEENERRRRYDDSDDQDGGLF